MFSLWLWNYQPLWSAQTSNSMLKCLSDLSKFSIMSRLESRIWMNFSAFSPLQSTFSSHTFDPAILALGISLGLQDPWNCWHYFERWSCTQHPCIESFVCRASLHHCDKVLCIKELPPIVWTNPRSNYYVEGSMVEYCLQAWSREFPCLRENVSTLGTLCCIDFETDSWIGWLSISFGFELWTLLMM